MFTYRVPILKITTKVFDRIASIKPQLRSLDRPIATITAMAQTGHPDRSRPTHFPLLRFVRRRLAA
jgi:hypothetical protein